jgi:hypothetical protein
VADPSPAPETRVAASRSVASRQPGVREVLLVAAIVVVAVLAAAALTALLPKDAQAVVFHTPLLSVVLVLGTAIVLWRILRAPST